jgi:transposase
MDSTRVVTQSEHLKINAKGYNPDFEFDKQIRMMYCFAEELTQPVYYRLLNGNVSDVTALSHCLQELNIANVILVADKGFYSANNVETLQNQGLQFIIPLKRDNHHIDYSPIEMGNLKKTCQVFQYQKRIIWYYMYENSNQKFVTFLDTRLQTEEENNYLQRIMDGFEEYTHEKFLEKSKTFGTLTLTYNVRKKISAQQIYEIYKKRNEIEIMFDCYKNFIKADTMYMQDRYVLEGWLFGNFLAMIAYYKLFERLRTNKMLNKYSPKDIIEIGLSIYKICINGEWTTAPIPRKTLSLLTKLQFNLEKIIKG